MRADTGQDRLQALGQGLDILAPPLDIHDNRQIDHLAVHHSQGFAEYGVDEFGRHATHQPLDTDPYVEIDPVIPIEDVRSWMDTELAPEVVLRHGVHDLWAADCGVSRYMQVKRDVEISLAQRFPELYAME